MSRSENSYVVSSIQNKKQNFGWSWALTLYSGMAILSAINPCSLWY